MLLLAMFSLLVNSLPPGYIAESIGWPFRRLLVQLGYRRQFLIAPVSADRFVSGLGTFSFARDGRGVVTGFEIDAGRVLNLKFQRN